MSLSNSTGLGCHEALFPETFTPVVARGARPADTRFSAVNK